MPAASGALSALVGRATARGLRERQEDRTVIARPGDALLVAVLDGHGGAGVASRAARALPGEVERRIRDGQAPREALAGAIAALDAALRDLHTGTTLTAALLRSPRLAAAQLGDSRLLLVAPGGARLLTRDHRLTDPAERRRVLAAGAWLDGSYVMRGDRGLMVTRALGDHHFRPVGVLGRPDVQEVSVPAGARALVAGTDGLWDVLSPEAVAAQVGRAASARAAAEALVRAALDAGSRDNVTAVVVDLARWAAGRPPRRRPS